MAIIEVWVEFASPQQAEQVLDNLARYITPESESPIIGMTEDHGGIDNKSCLALTLRRPDDDKPEDLAAFLGNLGKELDAQKISQNHTTLWSRSP